jgi:hypothetical protein
LSQFRKLEVVRIRKIKIVTTQQFGKLQAVTTQETAGCHNVENLRLSNSDNCRFTNSKLKRLELLKKFPAFYGTRRFITAFTRAHHLSLS